ncbi:rod-determining factor RdfA [Halorussus sp. AFM4]|uniref:rod-determining factor RdfA n=1 Tax=Halorussus sp. AFM4 TaxID=3421651 RepID=UPI003EBFDB44
MESDSGCKVDRVIEEYDLDSADPRHDRMDEGLLARWRGDNGHSAEGYRTLTEWFNKRLLRRVFDENGRDALGARVDHDYEMLTGDDDLLREETIESLADDGIDGARVREDMVSWGTMRTHLQDCLNGEKDTRSKETDWERKSVDMATSFAREKIETVLSSLASDGELEGVETSSVTVQVQVSCDICPTRVPLDVALERGYVCEEHGRTSTQADTQTNT